MNNQNETIGLRVLSVSPSHTESNVNVNSSIDVTFSSDINPATLTKNIVVFEDYNKVYKDATSLKDYSKFSVVKGSITYNDKVLTYTPDKPFNTNSCYILVLNDKIADIIGNQLVQKCINVFYTEKVARYGRCELVSPKYGYITNSIPTFTWINQKSPSYIFQISKINSFESLLLDEVIPGNEYEDEISYTPDFNAQEGMYFIRVKSENGEWSDTHQIFIKPITDAVIAQEDTSEMLAFEDFMDNILDPIVILEYFPEPNSVNNSLKTNIFYIKIKGKVDDSRIDLNNCYVYGESLDDDHEEYSHESVNGNWSIIYDSFYDATYVVFTPYLLNPTEEEQEEENIEEPTDEEPNSDEPNNSETENNNSESEDQNNNNENTGENTSDNTEESSEENQEITDNPSEQSEQTEDNSSENEDDTSESENNEEQTENIENEEKEEETS